MWVIYLRGRLIAQANWSLDPVDLQVKPLWFGIAPVSIDQQSLVRSTKPAGLRPVLPGLECSGKVFQ